MLIVSEVVGPTADIAEKNSPQTLLVRLVCSGSSEHFPLIDAQHSRFDTLPLDFCLILLAFYLVSSHRLNLQEALQIIISSLRTCFDRVIVPIVGIKLLTLPSSCHEAHV